MSFARCMIRYYFVVGVVLSASALSMLGVGQAQAQEKATKSALAVSPAIIEKSLMPGKVTKFRLNVRNITDSPLPVVGFARPFTVQSKELEKTDHVRLDASGWFTLDEPEFILQPNQERDVTGTMRPPADAEPGGHYATVFFQPLVAQEETHPTMARISARVGVLSFLTVKGEVAEKAELASPLQSPQLTRSGPITMTFKIANTGNVHIMPKGMIDIYDWRGTRVAAIEIPTGLLLPNVTKPYTIAWNDTSVFGRYRAELSLEYGAEQLRLEKSVTSFWVMPWVELVVGFVVLGMLALFIRRTRRRWGRAWHALRSGSSRK